MNFAFHQKYAVYQNSLFTAANIGFKGSEGLQNTILDLWF